MSRKRYKIETYFQWKTNRKSYVAYRMAPVLVTLNDLEGHSPVAGLFKCNPSNICAVFYQISTDSALARSLSVSWASCFGYSPYVVTCQLLISVQWISLANIHVFHAWRYFCLTSYERNGLTTALGKLPAWEPVVNVAGIWMSFETISVSETDAALTVSISTLVSGISVVSRSIGRPEAVWVWDVSVSATLCCVNTGGDGVSEISVLKRVGRVGVPDPRVFSPETCFRSGNGGMYPLSHETGWSNARGHFTNAWPDVMFK